MTSHRRLVRRAIYAITCLALTGSLAACGGGGGEGPGEAAKTTLVSSKLAAKAKADPLSPYPTQKSKLPTVKIGQSFPALSFAPMDVAAEMNFYKYLGVNVEYQTLQAGATMLQAISSGSIKMGNSGSTEMATAAEKGLPLQAVQNTAMMTLQLCVSKEWAASKGVTPKSPLKDRINALKGAKIGITGPGSASDTIARYLIKNNSKLDPDKDMSLVQVGGSAFAPSLDDGKIEGFVLSSPACQQSKKGEVLVQPTEVKEFRDYTYEVLYVRKDWVEKNADAAVRVATAISMGNNFILKHPDEAIAIMQKKYSEVDPAIVEKAMKENVIPNIRRNGVFTKEMWDSTSNILVDGGFIEKDFDTSSGKVWTNDYVNVKYTKVY